MKWFNAVLIVFLNSFALATDITCKGGDGPTPLANISHHFPQQAISLRTFGEVSEFIHWPHSRSIIYRSNRGELRELNYKTQADKWLAKLQLPMSRLVDPHEKYVLTNRFNWYLDTEVLKPIWGKFYTDGTVEHLFWNRSFLGKNNLFSLARFFNEKQQSLEIQKFTAGKIKPDTCVLQGVAGETLSLGEGHEYPNVFLYRQTPVGNRTQLTLYHIKIGTDDKTCQLEILKNYPEAIEGEIQSVHQFAKSNAYAVVTETPKGYRLYWDSNNNYPLVCNFGNRMPLVINHKQPIVAGWEESTGLSILKPKSKQWASVLPKLTKEEVILKNLFLSEDAEEFFLNLQDSKGVRKLHFLDLDDRISAEGNDIF